MRGYFVYLVIIAALAWLIVSPVVQTIHNATAVLTTP